jgi:hypothetical protein
MVILKGEKEENDEKKIHNMVIYQYIDVFSHEKA